MSTDIFDRLNLRRGKPGMLLTSFNAQDCPLQQEIIWPQMSIEPLLSILFFFFNAACKVQMGI